MLDCSGTEFFEIKSDSIELDSNQTVEKVRAVETAFSAGGESKLVWGVGKRSWLVGVTHSWIVRRLENHTKGAGC